MRLFHTPLLLIAALVLAACNPAVQPPAQDETPAAGESAVVGTPADGEPVTITFGSGEWERAGFQTLIDRFNSENPDVRVQFVSLDPVYMGGGSNMDDQLRQIASAADTATAFGLTREAIGRGYFTDLEPLIAADTTFDRADFYPGALEAASSNGAIYLLPRNMSLQLLSYNKELWDRAGLAAPKPDWTWDELLAAAEQITRKRGDTVEVYGMADWGSLSILEGLLSQSNISLRDMAAGQGRFDQPELAAAMQRVDTLVKSGTLLLLGVDNGQIVSPQEKINKQEVGIWWQGMRFGGPGEQQPSFSIGTLPAPRSTSGVQRNVQGYVMSSGTAHPEAAWRWLSFLSRQQIEQRGGMVSIGGDLPARKSVAEQSGYWSKLDAETRAAIEATLAGPAAPGLFSFDQAYISALNNAVNQVVSGKQTTEQALREASTTYEQALAQAGQTPTPARDGPIVVATPQPAVVAAEGAIRVRFGSFGFDQAELRKLADEFNQSQPEVFVEIVEPNRTGQVFRLDFLKQAEQSDAFIWYGLPDTNELTMTLDLQPLIDADPDFRPEDYPAALLAAFRQDGKLFGLPHALDLRVVQYNPKLFEQAGLEPPRSDWTLEQYLDAAQRLTSGDEPNKQYGFSADGTLGLEFVLDASGASLTTGQGDQIRPNYSDPKVAEATRRFIDLARSASPNKELTGYRGGGVMIGTFDTVRQGRVGIWLSYGLPGEFGGPATEAGIVAPPLAQSGLSADNFSFNGLYISAKASDPQAVWRWVKFLSQSNAGLRGRFPARSSLAQSDEFLRQAPPGAAEVYRAYSAALANNPPPRTRDRRGQAGLERYWFFRAVDEVLQGKQRDLERALADAQTLTEQYLDCVQAGDTEPNCAKQVDPSYDGFLLGPR